MKIGMNSMNIGQQNSFINVHRVNQGLARAGGNEAASAKNSSGRRDRVSLSPQNKATSLLEGLAQQKQSIKDQKNKLIASTLESGGSLDSIKNQLKSYEEQLKNVDLQMTSAMAQTAQTQTEKAKESAEESKNQKPKTEEEVQAKRLTDVTKLSASLEEAKTISSVKSRLEGAAKVLKSEMSLTTQPAMLETKSEKLAELEGRAVTLSNKLGEKLSETTEKVTEGNQPMREKDGKDENNESGINGINKDNNKNAANDKEKDKI